MSQPNHGKSSGRGAKILIGTLVGLIAIAAVVLGVDYFLNKDKVPRGATVGGIAIGGMSPEEARTTLEYSLGGAVEEPVIIHAGELQSQLIPAQSGISVNWQETVEAAGTQSLNPVTRLLGLSRDYEVDIVSDVDPAVLTPTLDRVERDLTREPTDATVTIETGAVETTPAVNGQTISREELNDALATSWLDPAGVELDAEITEPAILDDSVQEVAEGPAARAVAAPLVAHGREEIDGIIPPERMPEVVTFHFEGGSFRTDVNVEAAQGILNETLGATEHERQEANISFASGSKAITPSVDGEEINWEETLADLPERITGEGEKEFEVIYIDDPAEFTTEQAEAATFNNTMGTFTTGGFSETSGTNMGITARTVNGAVVLPGETFSLNGFTGPRGTAQGYVEGGIILNGRADTAVGGGVSQFATTLYNAAYFAGMEDVAHTPHSYYINRYPAGREATIFDGAIDLQFRNTSDSPIRIDTSMSDSELTVSIIGVKTVEVESVNGGRWAQTSPNTVSVPADECSPSGGAPGFTTSDTRIIRDLSGNEISRETQTTVYDPQPIVRCS
ncbi:Vancomycin B-type resistance protein VanW [Corynebacterium occultum]|uniref:Vancomycin B-type resistance protein VanW n=1 Tax=Corynebacterium occultum TaxID=2675219 RepID=A0A6B8VZP7_9CORY|nr:VanW family protein [Corynebacterium occultum]QGU08469.1 Vancomycin B-type resistance protein VanW [Corynebacterium occultum]